MEKQKAKKSTSTKEALRLWGTKELSDALNPKYLFNGIDTQLIVNLLKDDVDVKELMKKELRSRGLDLNGFWVGFDK